MFLDSLLLHFLGSNWEGFKLIPLQSSGGSLKIWGEKKNILLNVLFIVLMCFQMFILIFLSYIINVIIKI